jgi:hypothetical protein
LATAKEEVPMWRQVPLGHEKLSSGTLLQVVKSSNIFECDGFLPTEKVVSYKTKHA